MLLLTLTVHQTRRQQVKISNSAEDCRAALHHQPTEQGTSPERADALQACHAAIATPTLRRHV